MDASQAIVILIYGIIMFGLGFYCYPKYNEVKMKLLNWLKSTPIVRGAKKPKRPVNLEIKVVCQYPIDGHNFTVIEKPDIDDYDRDLFNPGTTTRVGREKWSPREQVLIRDSLVQVTIRDGKIVAGQWVCPYTGKVFLDPKQIEIDHIVALGESWICGSKKWSSPQRSAFSRDLENLIAVSSTANREKGRNSIERWMPDREDVHLWYIQTWVYIKKKYDLGVSVEEIQFMAKYAQ